MHQERPKNMWRWAIRQRRGAVLCLALTSLAAGGPVRGQTEELAAIAKLAQQGKLPEAEKQVQVYLAKRPRSPKGNTLLGTIYMHEGRLDQAEAALLTAISAGPGLLEPRLALGETYLAEGKYESALSAYQEATKLVPHDVRANLALAKLYLANAEFAKSLQASGNIPSEKRPEELLPVLAADYFGLQQPEKAGLEVQSMLQVADKQPELVPELVEFFLAHHDFKSAKELIAAAQGKQPATDRFEVDLARAQAGLGQLEEAQKTLEGVFERKPDSLDALVTAGQVAAQQADWEASAEAFSRANSLAPDRPDILYGLTNAQLYDAHPEDALKNAQRLHALAPQDMRARYLLALALFGAKKWEEARMQAGVVLAAHPGDREMELILADVALNDEHNLQEARAQAESCLKQNANDPGALYYLGMVEKLEGDIGGAIQHLSKSVAGNPKNADAQGALGALCLQTGDMSCAVSSLELAANLAPELAQNHYQLALAYSRAGMADKAKAQLETYQQMKAKEEKDAKNLKGPSTSEVPSIGLPAHP